MEDFSIIYSPITEKRPLTNTLEVPKRVDVITVFVEILDDFIQLVQFFSTSVHQINFKIKNHPIISLIRI